jgi:hypothetical protein
LQAFEALQGMRIFSRPLTAVAITSTMVRDERSGRLTFTRAAVFILRSSRTATMSDANFSGV